MAITAHLHAAGSGREDSLQGSGQYRARRRSHLPASLRSGFLTQTIVVHDLSATEMLVESQQILVPGSLVHVTVGGDGGVDGDETLAAHVAWRDGSMYGCTLTAPLPSARLAALTAQARVIWSNFDRSQSSTSWRTRFARNAGRARVGSTLLDDGYPQEGRWSFPARLAVIAASATGCWMTLAMMAKTIF